MNDGLEQAMDLKFAINKASISMCIRVFVNALNTPGFLTELKMFDFMTLTMEASLGAHITQVHVVRRKKERRREWRVTPVHHLWPKP